METLRSPVCQTRLCHCCWYLNQKEIDTVIHGILTQNSDLLSLMTSLSISPTRQSLLLGLGGGLTNGS